MSDVLLPVALRGELISYLTSACAHRPFGEVQSIVAKLAMLAAAPEPDATAER